MANLEATTALSPKESGEFIVKNAKFVQVLEDGAAKCGEEAADWIFLVDTLNFSFWSGVSTDVEKPEGSSEPPKWEVSYKGENHTGYFGLCAGVNRAIDEGLDITNPKVYGSLSADDILRIFRSETSTPIPLVEDRVKNLHEAGRVLIEKYQGSFVNCIKACSNSAQALLKLVVNDFPSYRDEADFEGKRVSIYKRVQILIGDIWACFDGKDLGHFEDIETLTMFADYRVPQVLLHYGALKYSPQLMELLEKDNTLPNGDPREVEIRGASIHAVELVKENVRKRLVSADMPISRINSILIDHFLWDYRREHAKAMEKYPYHKTRCIYY
ncbi:hypothetical protein Ocin01_06291 [Orchesella cincta]|uniref:Queuosine 5'-phosphate N-glycosylase/hydrolase n=1 Tax=Orchesella cincta TaxID=48709 RepID=A0A1D2N534_ORCCI|nr:hypothetical protein Ocin01_06291 [Orchesella cincta]